MTAQDRAVPQCGKVSTHIRSSKSTMKLLTDEEDAGSDRCQTRVKVQFVQTRLKLCFEKFSIRAKSTCTIVALGEDSVPLSGSSDVPQWPRYSVSAVNRYAESVNGRMPKYRVRREALFLPMS